MVFWLPASRDREFQYWERIGTVPRAEIKVEHGICATPATSIRARQRLGGGLLGKTCPETDRDRQARSRGRCPTDSRRRSAASERPISCWPGPRTNRWLWTRIGPSPLAGIDAVSSPSATGCSWSPARRATAGEGQSPQGPAGTGNRRAGLPGRTGRAASRGGSPERRPLARSRRAHRPGHRDHERGRPEEGRRPPGKGRGAQLASSGTRHGNRCAEQPGIRPAGHGSSAGGAASARSGAASWFARSATRMPRSSSWSGWAWPMRTCATRPRPWHS